MKQHTRQFEVERASVDPEAGTFEAVLFTDGEASDGHILNIEGGKIPQRMPLFVGHSHDPTTQLGSLHFLRKTDHAVHVRGEVLTDGVGAPLEVRQDLLVKMAAGHVSRMSGLWDAKDKDAKRRVNLPSDHPAFVDDSKETEYRKRWGLYFEKWQAMEGSVVGLGADPQAVMRWARDEESPECVRDFWREHVPEAQAQGLLANLRNAASEALSAGIEPEQIADYLAEYIPHGRVLTATVCADELETPSLEGDPDPDDDGTADDQALDAIEERLEALEAAEPAELKALYERLDALEARLAEPATSKPDAIEEPEREEEKGAPLPSVIQPREVIVALSEGLDAARDRVSNHFRDQIVAARGKVETQ